MITTTRRVISRPNDDRSDRPDIPLFIKNVALAADVDVIYDQGTDAARIAVAHQAGGGRFWWTTDTKLLWYDDGTNWYQVGLRNLVGTYAARPAANTVSDGTKYHATDTLGAWRSDGSTWTLVSQGSPLVTVAQFGAAPFSTVPYDGQVVTLQLDSANGLNHQLRYNAGSGSTYKWESVGGSEMRTIVPTLTETPTTAYANFGTDVAITIPRAGDWQIRGRLSHIDSGSTTYFNTELNAAGQIDVTQNASGNAPDASTIALSLEGVAVGIAAATVARLRRKDLSGGVAYTFNNLQIYAKPIRIS